MRAAALRREIDQDRLVTAAQGHRGVVIMR
jgi:hypothetical protein